MALWRSASGAEPIDEASAVAALAALEARVDQVRAFFRDQVKAHRGNDLLCNTLLDAENLLHGPYPGDVS